ncbi:MAG: ssuA [Frankiales bacterium]|nr:ssuA [Frankiales bacterium]
MYQFGVIRGGLAVRAASAAVAATLVLGLAACSSSSSDTSAGAATSASGSNGAVDTSHVTLKVATYPAAVGSDETLLKAAGLLDTPYKVSFQTYPDGGTQTGAVNQGSADLARGSSVAGALLAGGGTKENFLSIATLKIPTTLQWTVANKSITSLAQLKGKKVAYTANTTAEYFLLKQLASVGLTLKDITPVPLAPANGLAALIGGSVVAFAGFGGTVQTAVAKGFPILADGGPILKGSLGGLAGAYNAYAPDLTDPAKAAAIADYVSRIDAAMAWTRANPAAWDQTVATATNQPLAVVTANFKLGENDTNSQVLPIQQTAIADQQTIADTFLAAGVLTKKVDVASTFSDALSAQIAADTAKYQAQYAANFAVTKVS